MISKYSGRWLTDDEIVLIWEFNLSWMGLCFRVKFNFDLYLQLFVSWYHFRLMVYVGNRMGKLILAYMEANNEGYQNRHEGQGWIDENRRSIWVWVSNAIECLVDIWNWLGRIYFDFKLLQVDGQWLNTNWEYTFWVKIDFNFW